MTKLTITRGYPGSGKTSWAQTLKAVRVNRDDLRAALFGKAGVLDNDSEQKVTKAQRAQIRALLHAGIDVVVDDTNLALKFARDLADIAVEAGAEFECVDFKVDLQTCIDRDAGRGELGERHVGEHVIRRIAKRYPMESWKPVTPHTITPYTYEKWIPAACPLPNVIITDIDGTLANHDGNRSPYDYSRVLGDAPIQHVIDTVNTLSRSLNADIIALSGRDDSCRADTELWLKRNRLDVTALHMRKTGDKRQDQIVKYELFRDHIANVYNVRAVFDDRLRVCKMWHAIGLPLFRVGDPEANF